MAEIVLDKRSVAIRPLRILPKTDELILYWAITFPKNPYQGVETYLRRLRAFGFSSCVENAEPLGDLGLDILDEDGDILHTFDVTRRGFEYLRKKLKFRVDRDEREPSV
jgi:hypothetical protein